MSKSKLYKALIMSSSLLPLVAFAQTKTIPIILGDVKDTLQTVIGVLFIIATVIFLWGLIRFVASAGDEAARTKAKGIMTWGIIGLAVMIAVWGIATLLTNYFGVGGVEIPRGPRQGSGSASQ